MGVLGVLVAEVRPPCLSARFGLGDMPDAVKELLKKAGEEPVAKALGKAAVNAGEMEETGARKIFRRFCSYGSGWQAVRVERGSSPSSSQLVARILGGEFVDMAELLRDNLEAQRRSSSIPANNSSSGSNPARARREVPDLLSWVQHFGIYMAVVASKHPERMRQLLA